MTFSLNLKGNLINWEETILHTYNIDFFEKTLNEVCLVQERFYALIGKRQGSKETMMKSKRNCETLGGKIPRLFNSPEVEEELKRLLKQNFGDVHGK